jgi:hypothetical protein
MLPLAAYRHRDRETTHIFRVARAALITRPVGKDEVQRNTAQDLDPVLAESFSPIAMATPACTASWPLIGGQVPIRPWRCSLSALVSKVRISTMSR